MTLRRLAPALALLAAPCVPAAAAHAVAPSVQPPSGQPSSDQTPSDQAAPVESPALAGIVASLSPQQLLMVLDGMDIPARLEALPPGRAASVHPLGLTAETDGLYWDAIFYNCAPAPVPMSQRLALAPERPEQAQGAGEDAAADGVRAGRPCRDFALSAGFDLEYPVSVQTINRFNRDYRFARAVLSESGAPHIEMDVNLEGGINREALEVEIRAWRAILAEFARFVGY